MSTYTFPTPPNPEHYEAGMLRLAAEFGLAYTPR